MYRNKYVSQTNLTKFKLSENQFKRTDLKQFKLPTKALFDLRIQTVNSNLLVMVWLQIHDNQTPLRQSTHQI